MRGGISETSVSSINYQKVDGGSIMSKRETAISDQKPGRDDQMAAASLVMFGFVFIGELGSMRFVTMH